MSMSAEKLGSALIILTQKNEIVWNVSHEHEDQYLGHLFENARLDGRVYESKINEKIVLLFRFSRDIYLGEDDPRPTHSFMLKILDSDGQPETEIEGKYPLKQLYDLVREACHGVDDWAENVVQLARTNR